MDTRIYINESYGNRVPGHICSLTSLFGSFREIRDIDITSIKLEHNPDIWFTEILWSLLNNSANAEKDHWIIGGDFNSSVLFDLPRDRSNREIIQRLHALGMTDCLSHFNDGPVPTFRHSRREALHTSSTTVM